MPQSERIQARLQSLDERLTRLRMKKGRLIARAGHAERKRDTRRKILIGGAVLAAIAHEGVPMLRSNAELLRSLDAQLTRQHDRDVFELAPECAPAAKPVRPLSATRPAAERRSRMPTTGRHREAARRVLDGRASEGHHFDGAERRHQIRARFNAYGIDVLSREP